MKRITILLAIIIFCTKTLAQDFSVSAGNIEAFVTESFNMEISLSNQKEISSFQCDIILPGGITIQGKPELSNRCHTSHTIRYNITRDGILKIVIHSTKSEAIKGNDGALFILPLTSNEDCEAGRKDFFVNNVIASTPEGTELKAYETKGNIILKENPIQLNKKETELFIGEKETLSLSFLPEYSFDKTVTWTSSNNYIANVSNNGEIKALKNGTAKITATAANGIHVSCTVTVKKINAERVLLSDSSLTLAIGNSYSIKANVLPENTTDKTVAWTSSNEKCVTVNRFGEIKTVGIGKALITAACGEVSSTCEVTVVPFRLNAYNLKMYVSDEFYLYVDQFANSKVESISFECSDGAVVELSKNGDTGCKINAISSGTSIITIYCGGESAKCLVTVSSNEKSIKLDRAEIIIKKGKTEWLQATVFPEDALDKRVIWSSSDNNIVTVSGGQLRGVNVGNATVSATCGNAMATCDVKVNPENAVESLVLSYNIIKHVGEISEITAFAYPGNADKTISWSVSDESVVKITETTTNINGGQAKIIAVGLGSATVTATAVGGIKEDVTFNIMSLSLNKTEINIRPEEEETLIATILPEDFEDKTVKWSSSNTSIVTVDENGKVTAIAVGTATITATAVGGAKAECAVTVNPIVSEGVALDKTALTLLVGESGTLVATVLPENTTDKTVVWTTSDEKVATVTSDGKVTAIAVGTATITATAVGGAKAECAVTVNPIVSEGVALDKTALTLLVGEAGTLVATVLPENTTDKTVMWTTSDENVATVSTDGKVTAVAVGTAAITATNGAQSATCVVTVNPVLAESVTLGKAEVTLLIGQTEELTATVSPDNATDKTIVWTTSDEKVATVTSDGKVTAVAVGTATITATAAGGAKAECAVTVNPIVSESVVLDKTALTLLVGEASTLVATVLPENTTDKAVVWTTSDEKVATVTSDGKVTAVAVGTATITATAVGGAKAECAVTVNPIVSEGVALDKTALTLLVGEAGTLVATVLPENTTDKTVVWTTSDEKVATVTSDGKVTAVAVGTTTITATAADGSGVSASCVVTVNPVLNLDIVQGWNWISTFLDEPQAVDGLFANGVNRVLSQTQEAVDDPVYGVVGNVTSIEPGAGYKVSSAKDFALTWSGLLVDTDERPIVLRKGWNWIGYPYYEARDIASAIVNAEEGDFVVAQGGFTEFADGAWGGSIERFDAGQGYLYKSVSDKTLQFDFAEQAARVKAAEGDEPTPNTNDLGSNADGSAYSVHGSKSKTKNTGLDIHKYPNTMNVTARLWREGAEVTDSRYVVKAFSDSELRGEGVCVNGTHYVTVYGDKAVEIAFVVEDTETGEQFSVAETLAFTSDVVGSRKSPFALTMDKATGIAGAKTDGNAADIYTVSGVKVQRASRPGVYVVNGRKVVVR